MTLLYEATERSIQGFNTPLPHPYSPSPSQPAAPRHRRTHTTRREMIQDTMAGSGGARGGGTRPGPRMQVPEVERRRQQQEPQ